MMQFKDRLTKAREAKGLTRQQMPELLGIAGSTYPQWELGNRQPDYEMLKKIANVLDVTIDHLIDHSHDKELIENMELKYLIPPLAADEKDQLEKSIVAEGCRDPLVVWNGTIIDGHNRYEICQKHSIPFRVINMTFQSMDDVRVWMIHNQLGRRNLTDAQRVEIGMKLKPSIKKEIAEERIEKISLTKQGKDIPAILQEGKETDQVVAEMVGLKTRTFQKGSKVLENAPKEVKQDYLDGKISTDKAFKELQNKPEFDLWEKIWSEQKKLDQRKAEFIDKDMAHYPPEERKKFEDFRRETLRREVLTWTDKEREVFLSEL